MDDTGKKTRKSQDILRAEMERAKRDLYKVFNPTNQDFKVILNAAISPEVWVIKSHEESIVPNYVRIKYFEEMTSKIIYAKSDKQVIEENEKRMQKGFDKMNLHTEQMRYESRNLKNLLSKQQKIVAVLDRGLYKEYGLGNDEVKNTADTREKIRDFDPDSALSLLDKPDVVKEPIKTPLSDLPTQEGEARKEQIRQARIANIAKAREAKHASV